MSGNDQAPIKRRRASYGIGERLEGTVERIVPGGTGLVRGPKGTVLVDRTAPGDIVRIEVDSVRAGAPRGQLLELVRPGPGRIEPPCPWYGACGGCDMQHLAYPAQIEAKLQIVEDALARIGGITLPEPIDIFSAPRPFSSRSRIELHSEHETQEIGFYERRSRRIVPIDRCMVSRDEINSALQDIRRSNQPYPDSIQLLSGYDEVRSQPAFPPLRGGPLWITIGELAYLADPGSFFQASLDLLPALIERVTSSLPEDGGMAWDLYCGAGLFTLPLAKRVQYVMGVDFDPRTTGNATRSAGRNGIGNASFTAADVTAWVSNREGSRARPDLIVVDPPRAGLDRKLAGLLAERGVKRLTYVSCDPSTLARDLRILTSGGLRVVDVAIFDLFPQTHHVETVVRLSVSDKT